MENMNRSESNLIEKAIAVAPKAHAGRKDKANEPYILHPLRVMLQMRTEEERLAAVLHDVVEDSDTTIKDLQRAGFPAEVIEAVRLLTRLREDTYDEFIEKLKPDPLARRVKIADLRDNLRLERIPHPTREDEVRFEKCRNALRLLEAS